MCMEKSRENIIGEGLLVASERESYTAKKRDGDRCGRTLESR